MAYKICGVVGARPNYMKIAPIWRELEKNPDADSFLIHTGQHYDERMSKVFFDDLKLPRPDAFLGVGSGTHGAQTGRVMIETEPVLMKERPDILVVVGDVNSTMASALVATKLGIAVAHVEAGLRSFDRDMPEEINRIVTDRVSDLLFTTEASGSEHLKSEGVDPAKIHFVGNVMIDSILFYRRLADRSTVLEDLSLAPGSYGLVTLHRPSNVDALDQLESILDALATVGEDVPLIFPAHPRTHKMMEDNGLQYPESRVRVIPPTGYLDFVKLMSHAKLVLTDSGGIQEETTVLGIPCLTIRENTERPITIEIGTNILVGTKPDRIIQAARGVLNGPTREHRVPDLWDGRAAERIVRVINEYCL